MEENKSPIADARTVGSEEIDETDNIFTYKRLALKAALDYQRKGYSVIPCKPKSKEPLVTWAEYQDRLATEEEIQKWWRKWPEANIGIATGRVSDIIVLEVDDKDSIEGNPIPVTPKSISGGRRLPHYYFKYGSAVKNYKHQINGKELFSVRSDGSYIIVPPSIHPSGNPYFWAKGLGIHQVRLANPPGWLEDLTFQDSKDEAEKNFSYDECDDSFRGLITEIKTKINLTDLLLQFGYKGKRCGNYSRFNCPFHEDGQNPDFIVWDDICGGHDYHDDEGYDVIKLLMKIKGFEFMEAVEFLAKRARVEVPKSRGNKTLAEQLVALAEDLDVFLFHDEDGESYAKFSEGNNFEIWKVKNRQFRMWLLKNFWELKGKAVSPNIVNSALIILEAKARFDGSEYKLHNRVASHGGAIWYDLGEGRAVRVTDEGWTIIDDAPILFKRYKHQKAQPIPENTDSNNINKIFKYVRITQPGPQLLFIVSLVTNFVPDIPHPVDAFHGQQGSAKSTALKAKKKLVDPSVVESMTNPYKKDEFIQFASHHWHISLDNLTYIPDWLSDCLCRCVTGEGSSKRELYTDDEDVLYSFKHCISLNGINLVPTKPDLLDRTLIFELEKMPPKERKREKKLWKEFEKDKPLILGAIFDLLSKAMKEYGNVTLHEMPRMADFATWGCAVARALGKTDKDFIEAYQANMNVQNDEAIEASPIALAIIAFMKNISKWEGHASDLLEILVEVAMLNRINTAGKRWPGDSSWVWRRIKEVQPNLEAVGIEASKDDSSRNSGGRKIILQNIHFKPPAG